MKKSSSGGPLQNKSLKLFCSRLHNETLWRLGCSTAVEQTLCNLEAVGSNCAFSSSSINLFQLSFTSGVYLISSVKEVHF